MYLNSECIGLVAFFKWANCFDWSKYLNLYLNISFIVFNWQDVVALVDKVCEMAAVMQKAVITDEKSAVRDQERITQLELENKGLREMLEVCTTTKMKILETDVNNDTVIEAEKE